MSKDKARAWKATAEQPRMYCTAGTLEQCFKALSKFCREESIDFTYAVTVNYWSDTDDWTVNLLY